jgi:hypothetical protein
MATISALNKLALGAGGVTVIGLFTILFMMSGVSYSSSGDSICNKLECEAFITVNTSTKICFEHSNNSNIIYKKLGSTTVWANLAKVNNIVDSNPKVPVDWYVKKAKTGALSKNWTPIYDGYCWTGKKNENKLVFHSTKPEVIKWSFIISDKINIDPELTSWSFLYPNKTITEKEALMNWTTCYKWTYKNVTIEVPCDAKNVTEHCFKCKVVNVSQTDCKNYTYQVEDKQVSYDCWQEVIIEVEKTVPDTSKPKTGIQVGSKVIMKPWISVYNNTYLIEFTVPIGDRNWNEYPYRQYELDKGVATMQRLDSPNLSVSK